MGSTCKCLAHSKDVGSIPTASIGEERWFGKYFYLHLRFMLE